MKPRRKEGRSSTHQRTESPDPGRAGPAVRKCRPPTTPALWAAGLVVFAFTFFATPAFAQQGTTVVSTTGGGSSDLFTPSSTTQPASDGAATTSDPGAATTASDPAATVPSATTIPTGQSQYSGAVPSQYSGDPPQQNTLANTGGISPIAIVAGVMVVLAAFGVWLGLRRNPEAPNE